jgi:hypothetical protein
MSNLTKKQAQFVAAARAQFPNATVLTRPQIIQVCERAGLNMPQWLTNSPDYRAGRGQYRIPALTGGAGGRGYRLV